MFQGVFTMRQVQGAVWVFGVLAMLSGCGGGGDEAASVAQIPLTAANYQAVSAAVVDSVSGVDALAASLDTVSAAHQTTAVPNALLSAQPAVLSRYALDQVRQLTVSKRVQAQAVETVTESCAGGGSLRVTANDADNNGEASSGDSVTIVASNCMPEIGASAVNGQLSLRLGNVVVDVYGEVTSGTVSVSFVNFSTEGVTIHGSAVMTVNASSLALDFNGLQMSDGSVTQVLDYKATVYRDGTATIAGVIELDGSSYTLATLERIVLGTSSPTDGTVRITDGHGNRVDVAIMSTGYTCSLYLKGDEIADGVTTLSW
jgi:hypothetical protein